MKRDDVNAVFAKLAYIAGSRQRVWREISRLHRELGRTPTLGEVIAAVA